jgi:hypothetical protein
MTRRSEQLQALEEIWRRRVDEAREQYLAAAGGERKREARAGTCVCCEFSRI